VVVLLFDTGCWIISACSIQGSYRKDIVCHARNSYW